MGTTIAAFLIALAGPLSAGPQDEMIALLRSRMVRRHAAVGRYVMAFYYPWYGTPEFGGAERHWGKWDAARKDAPASRRWPVGGPYDSTDPMVVDRHMAEFAQAGIDVPIVSWWGKGDHSDKAMRVILDQAAKHGRKVTVYFEVVRGEPPTAASAAEDLNYLAKQYTSHPAWLRLGRQPVIFLYGRVMHQLGDVKWCQALDLARKQSGVDWIAIADGINAGYGALFDGIHSYNTMGSYLNRPESAWAGVARAHMTDSIRFARPFEHIACATIVPGYDDTKIRKPGANLDRFGGRLYDAQWQVALETQPDWLLITSFNEWHEGSEIEPSAELGDRYLKATAAWTAKWRQSKPKRGAVVAAMKSARKADDELKKVVCGKVGGRIGLLNGIGPVGMRLIRVTDQLDLIEPTDLVSGKVTPKSHRLLIYTTGENFPTRVKAENDVPKAIAAYVAAGGGLLVFSDQPFPFFYDENHRAVDAGRLFDLHLLGSLATKSGKPFDQDNGPAGFETPPPGLDLKFAVAAELPTLPSSVPFPSGGDRRWRPAYRPKDRDPDRPYWPLMKLVDQHGRDWGEAVAGFGPRDPHAGKVVYAWFRLADVAGLDGFLGDLLGLGVLPVRK
jgi:glycoprotein endo-alpha-1,2-mannosidase